MIEVRVSEARRELSEHINRVAFGNERIVLTRHGKGVVALVSVEDAEYLEQLERGEDAEDMAILSERLKDTDASDYIPHAEIAAEIYGDAGPRPG